MPGRNHSAGEVMGKDKQEEHVKVARSHSSFQVKDIHKMQRHSVQERHGTLGHGKRNLFLATIKQSVNLFYTQFKNKLV